MERQRDTSGRDVDRYRSERAGQHKRISYREMDGDQRRTDGRRRDISRDDSRSVTSDEEGANEKLRRKNKDKATDGSKYDIDRSGRRRDVRADEEDASDRRKVEFTKDRKIRGRSKDISSDDDDDSDRRNMKKREDRRKSDGHDLSDEDRETERTGIKPEEKSDEEDGEFRRSDRKGAHEVDHLITHQVVDELIALELLTMLLVNPTDDSVEVAVGVTTECGSILQDPSPKAMFESFRGSLHEGEREKRVQYLIEGLKKGQVPGPTVLHDQQSSLRKL